MRLALTPEQKDFHLYVKVYSHNVERDILKPLYYSQCTRFSLFIPANGKFGPKCFNAGSLASVFARSEVTTTNMFSYGTNNPALQIEV